MHMHMISYFCLLLPSAPYVAVSVELDVRWIPLENQKCLSVLSLKPGEACSGSCSSSSFSSVGLMCGRIIWFPFLFPELKQPSV